MLRTADSGLYPEASSSLGDFEGEHEYAAAASDDHASSGTGSHRSDAELAVMDAGLAATQAASIAASIATAIASAVPDAVSEEVVLAAGKVTMVAGQLVFGHSAFDEISAHDDAAAYSAAADVSSQLEASACRLVGAGLKRASIRTTAFFTIETDQACVTTHGFSCIIRPETRGRRGIKSVSIESRVDDDASLLVSYTPSTAGNFLIHVSLHGEELPGSPSALTVCDGTACIELCEVSGSALREVVARRSEAFDVAFHDRSGNPAHAIDLDVYVERGNAAHNTSALPSPLTQEMLDGGLEIAVGPAPLPVRQSLDVSSSRIGMIAAGRPLKVLRLERFEEAGVLCACVIMLDHEPRRAARTQATYRELYASEPEWRTPRLRKMWREEQARELREAAVAAAEKEASEIAERRREAINAEARALAEAEQEAAAAAAAAAAVEQARRRAEQKAARKREAQEAREIATGAVKKRGNGRDHPGPGRAPRQQGKANGDGDGGGRDKGSNSAASHQKDAKLASQAATMSLDGEKSIVSAEGAVAATQDHEDERTDGAANSDGLAAAATASSAAPDANDATHDGFTNEGQRRAARSRWQQARTKLASHAGREMIEASAEEAGRVLAAEADGSCGSQSHSNLRASLESAKHGRSTSEQGGGVDLGDGILHGAGPSGSSWQRERWRREEDARQQNEANPKALTSQAGVVDSDVKHWGWVTIAEDGHQPLVVRLPEPALHPSRRLRYSRLWERRCAVTSERELSRALAIDEHRQNVMIERGGINAGSSSLAVGAAAPPKSAFLSEVEADPEGIGMAYGGVTPGRLGHKGLPVATHKVHYSVGLAGHYLLHVRVHGQPTDLPGSPFPLVVRPGPAHALATRMPEEMLPLRGFFERWKPPSGDLKEAFQQAYRQHSSSGIRLVSNAFGDSHAFGAHDQDLVGDRAPAFSPARPRPKPFRASHESAVRAHCAIKMQSRDKCGNACSEGGAKIEIGRIPRRDLRKRSDGRASATNADTCSFNGATPDSLHSSVTDCGNGLYTLEWWSVAGGEFDVYVKIDGLHVIGSPSLLVLASDEPELSKAVLRRLPAKGEVGKPLSFGCQLVDATGNPAIPGKHQRFGVSLVTAADKEPDAWRRAKPHLVEWLHSGTDELELSFSPMLAGDLHAFIWSINVRSGKKVVRNSSATPGKKSSRGGSPQRKAGKSSSTKGARAAASGGGSPDHVLSKEPSPHRRKKSARKKSARKRNHTTTRRSEPVAGLLAELEQQPPQARTLLSSTSGSAGGGWQLKVVPAPPSAAHSRIDGLFVSDHGRWKHYANGVQVSPTSSSAATSGAAQSATLKDSQEATADGGGDAANGGESESTADAAAPESSESCLAGDTGTASGGGNGACSNSSELCEAHTTEQAIKAASKMATHDSSIEPNSSPGKASSETTPQRAVRGRNQRAFSSGGSGNGRAGKEHGRSGESGMPDEPQAFLVVGDTVGVKPEIFDQHGNRAGAVDSHAGSLEVSIAAQGKASESLSVQPLLNHGVWTHDVVYELKHVGLHRISVTLNGEHIVGSPVEWLVKIRPASWAPPTHSVAPSRIT